LMRISKSEDGFLICALPYCFFSQSQYDAFNIQSAKAAVACGFENIIRP
jgi:hypothetical protein